MRAVSFYFAAKITRRMNTHTCLICIGSNFENQENLAFARQELANYFPDIVYSEEKITSPLFLQKNTNPFSNQLARFSSDYSIEEIERICKSIERKAGRTGEEKKSEIIRLDIDLLKFDGIILKPEDMKREYIRNLLKNMLFHSII